MLPVVPAWAKPIEFAIAAPAGERYTVKIDLTINGEGKGDLDIRRGAVVKPLDEYGIEVKGPSTVLLDENTVIDRFVMIQRNGKKCFISFQGKGGRMEVLSYRDSHKLINATFTKNSITFK
ncbi:MAG: hypothetical protein P4L36_14440 [Holophaga sp.]|nr:hypothetical protein [Holophaga sp.]